jgi:hypothetical protein
MASLDEQTYATNILLEKRARKLAEEDALRLYNRVRQLQKEEDKAARRIQDTKKKAKEIIKLRERNELLRQEKEARLAQLALEIERQKQDNLKLKEEIIRNKTEQENRIWADKVTVAQQTKEEKAEIEKLLAESKLLSRKEALEQKEAVRRQQEEARRRIEQLKVNRLQMVSRVLDMHARLAHLFCTSVLACKEPPMLAWLMLCVLSTIQAQDEYERRLREEMEAKAAKEAEIEELVRGRVNGEVQQWLACTQDC